MAEEFRQHHLVRGVTHWIAWFEDDQLRGLLEEGWSTQKSYDTVLVKTKDGVLVEKR